MAETTIEVALDQALDTLKAVITRQRSDTDPAHEDFYVWGYGLSEMTAQLEHLTTLLGRQVSSCGDRFILRDDEGGDPAARLREASALLVAVGESLSAANRAARAYHSAISHVAVEVNPGC